MNQWGSCLHHLIRPGACDYVLSKLLRTREGMVKYAPLKAPHSELKEMHEIMHNAPHSSTRRDLEKTRAAGKYLPNGI